MAFWAGAELRLKCNPLTINNIYHDDDDDDDDDDDEDDDVDNDDDDDGLDDDDLVTSAPINNDPLKVAAISAQECLSPALHHDHDDHDNLLDEHDNDHDDDADDLYYNN